MDHCIRVMAASSRRLRILLGHLRQFHDFHPRSRSPRYVHQSMFPVNRGSGSPQQLSMRHLSTTLDENNPPQPPNSNDDTIFDKFIRGDIPVDKVYEDENCIAFPDINPQAPTHILIIPKKKIVRMRDALDEDKDALGCLLIGARNTAKKLGLDDGYRLVINDGPQGGQTVYYLHVHLLSGRQMLWPPG